jgi:hypothetical protein
VCLVIAIIAGVCGSTTLRALAPTAGQSDPWITSGVTSQARAWLFSLETRAIEVNGVWSKLSTASENENTIRVRRFPSPSGKRF